MCFVLAGHLLVLQRRPNGPTEYLTIRGDSLAYVAMVEGHWAAAPVPFRYRVLVPMVAQLLPWSPLASLRVITYVSLLGSYMLILLACFRLGLSTKASALGLFAVWSATSQLYYYHNPFLTDGFGMLALSAMVFALTVNSFELFLVASVLGVLGREAVLVLVPAWFLCRDTRRGTHALVAAVAAFAAPRLLIGAPGDLGHAVKTAFLTSAAFSDPGLWARSAFVSWGLVWLLALAGIWLLSGKKMHEHLLVLISLAGGAVVLSFFAKDTDRMFAIAAPILAIGCAELFGALVTRRNRVLAGLAVPLIAGQALLALPNRFIVPRDSVPTVFRVAFAILGAGYVVAVAFTLRRKLSGSRGERLGVPE